MKPEYDALAKVYDLWSTGDPAWEPSHAFYTALGRGETGTVVELGVGTGRIAVDLARAGGRVVGIDHSPAMLARCRRRVREAGVGARVSLLRSDLIDVRLPEPADLVLLPFRTIGHFLTWEKRRQLLRTIRRNIRPGGRFAFDLYVLDPSWARTHDRIPRLLYAPLAGRSGPFVWDTYLYSFPTQTMRCVITVEWADARGVVQRRMHAPLSFSWFDPDVMRAVLGEEGFAIEALYGDFEKGPFDAQSSDQIWVVRCLGG